MRSTSTSQISPWQLRISSTKEKKWGLKEGTLDFGEAGDPFEGKDAGEVPVMKVELNTSENHKEKKSKKKKEPEPAMEV